MKRTRKEINRKKLLEVFDKIGSKSTLTLKDVLELSEKIKKGIARRHGLVRK